MKGFFISGLFFKHWFLDYIDLLSAPITPVYSCSCNSLRSLSFLTTPDLNEKLMNICFLMYPWEKVEPETDTTLRIIHEAALRGHRVAITHSNNLTIRDSESYAFCQVISSEQTISKNIPSFYRKVVFRKAMLPLSGFDIIMMRDNPPLESTALNFLDSVKGDTFIMNDIEGLRIANNKLYTTSFDDPDNQFIPKTHVSKNKEYLERVFVESGAERMILKPLVGFGGKGVIVIERSALSSFRSLLDYYISGEGRSNYVILQEYVEGAEKGDVRILMLNGEAIGAMKRIPSIGEVRSNVHAGGSVQKHVLTAKEKELCQLIGPKLVRDGLYFVGIDVINDKLIEVNVCSPGGITRINKLNRVKLQQKVVDFMEHVHSTKELVSLRKDKFRKAIDDAEMHFEPGY